MKFITDIKSRALKTFVQAFGGIFIPELCLVLSGNLPADINGWVAILIPLGCSALAAGISAAWNVISNKISEGELPE